MGTLERVYHELPFWIRNLTLQSEKQPFTCFRQKHLFREIANADCRPDAAVQRLSPAVHLCVRLGRMLAALYEAIFDKMFSTTLNKIICSRLIHYHGEINHILVT
jgi:hypothetical protein